MRTDQWVLLLFAASGVIFLITLFLRERRRVRRIPGKRKGK